MASITEFIKNIRNARLGKDVRESIASAIEQTYEDASKDGNANMEVSEARGTFDTLNQRLNNSENTSNQNISLINSKNTLIMGDSYAVGVDGTGQATLNSWANILKSLMGLSNRECTIVAEAGSGFLRAGTNNHTFLQLLQSKINNIENKSMIKNIILCGGYNDNEYTFTNIRNAVIEFVNYCYSQFENATVYIGCIAYRREVSQSAQTIRRNISEQVFSAYANNTNVNLLSKPYVYLSGVENILKTLPTTYMFSNNAHPNQAGQNALGQGIYQAFKMGYVNPYSSGAINLSNENASSINSNISFKRCDNNLNIVIPSIEIKFAEETNFALGVGDLTVIAQYQSNGFIGGILNENNIINAVCSIQDYNKGRHTVPCILMFDHSGDVRLWTWLTNTTNSSGASYQLDHIKQINIFRCQSTIPAILS